MKLPMPSAQEVERMRIVSRDKLGIDLTPEQAFEVLSNLVHFIYLTEYYEPNNPIRPQGEQEAGTMLGSGGADDAHPGIRQGETA